MKTNRLSGLLRGAAVIVLLAGFSTWAAAGARFGWTQTSIVTMQHDAITGIDFPVRAPAFRPGVEVPLLALGTAAAFAGMAWIAGRRRMARV